MYECVPIQIRSGVSFIQHLNVVRHLASSATENKCSLLAVHLIPGQAEDNAGALAGPVDHEVEVAVVEVEHGALGAVRVQDPGRGLQLRGLPRVPRVPLVPGAGVSEHRGHALQLVRVAAAEAEAWPRHQAQYHERGQRQCLCHWTAEPHLDDEDFLSSLLYFFIYKIRLA